MGKEYENDILYHYTDYQALDGILRQAQLRVNNVLNMNDAAEMRYFMDGLCDAVAGRLEGDGDHERAEWVRELFREELKKEFFYSAYAACFSLYRDDAAQWERYGNRGRGVCIAFLGEISPEDGPGRLVPPDSLLPGRHGRPQSDRRLLPAHEKEGKAAGRREGTGYQESHELCLELFRGVQAPFLFLRAGGAAGGLPSVKEFFDVSPCYHIAVERIKKYYPLDLMDMCQKAGIGLEELVPEIIIGPESTQSRSILQDYLRDNGLKELAERVSLSQCPLRRSLS